MKKEWRVTFKEMCYHDVYVNAHDGDEAMDLAAEQMDANPDDWHLMDREIIEVDVEVV